MKNILFTLFLLFSFTVFSQQTPAKKQTEAVSIVGATAHIGNGTVIENSLIVFKDGVLTTVDKNDNSTPTEGRVINAENKHVYPGFIAPNSTLGLGEIDAVKATIDDDETGEILPHVRSLIAYNAESKVVESMRPNGVLIAQITPRGGTISGTSSIVQLDAWNWEDAVVKTDGGIHLNWPNSFKRGRWWLGEPRGSKPDKDYEKHISKITMFLNQAKAYGASDRKPRDLPMEASLGLFDGSQKLFVHVDKEREIIDAVKNLIDVGVKNVVIVGGYEAHKTVDLLKKHQIPVLAKRTQSLPESNDDDLFLPYALPKILTEDGLLVGLEGSGRMERMSTRNLPFYAGQVVGQGLDAEKALSMITLSNAKILGIDNKYGSLEKGKSATLFISEGDALDMRTNKLSHAFIDGREVSLETHQTKLNKRYSEKYGVDD